MTRPDFQSLEAMPGRPDIRLVNGAWMDREQYELEGWFQTTIPGDKQPYWVARLDGLRRYGHLLRERTQQRRLSWQARNAEDESFRQYVDALDDAKPTR